MPLTFVIPGPLREFASNHTEVSVNGPAASVSDALALLWTEYPGLRDRVITELGELRPHVQVFVDGDSIRYADGFATAVQEGSEIVIMPALSGG
jgi:sulfur-carrier protein